MRVLLAANALGHELRERRARLDEACELAGRDPRSIRFTLMETCVIGRDKRAVDEALQRVLAFPGAKGFAGGDPPPHWLVGTPEVLAERLRGYAGAITACTCSTCCTRSSSRSS